MTQSPYIFVSRREDGSSELSISDLTLNRPDDGTPLVKNLNLTLKPGDRLLISGASGSGKSTLIRAIREIWESGQGKIDIPVNARILTASQRAYMPSLSLKGVLSYPEPETAFYDVQIEQALRAVGHDRLVQYLPGRQTHRIIDIVLDQIPALLKSIDQNFSQEKKVQALCDALLPTVPGIVKTNIDTAQSLTYQNERHLREDLIRRLDAEFGHSTLRPQIEHLATRLSDSLNQALVQNLVNHLVKDVPALLRKNLGKVQHIDMSSLNYFSDKASTRVLKQLEKSLVKSKINPLNEMQRKYIADQVREAISSHLNQHHTWNYSLNKVGSWVGKLGDTFNAITNPLTDRNLRLTAQGNLGKTLGAQFINAASTNMDMVVHGLRTPLLNRAARKSADYMLASTALYLAREFVNGDVLSKRLSGGEQQRLVFARALLHRPDILILDEVTAALDKEAGYQLYQEITEKLPQTIIISVAHNLHILPHHTLHGHLQDKVITVKPVKDGPQP